ncbi:S9 family peptidase [Mycolicibacterium thermoresistibile]|uniref:Peptidase S9 prolyl oligopeptidase n=2 Tax=Mycolicibacterium thermoresistibile TaxID=1797 RepID=G7CIX8_MYCT3|nr:S9 family peptidase [Mycolicibacterium thermoresistibile]EHI12657.1 peptidase S9 prolyl oligopeptidase [Mycolicibacterium thermoresistibile ATCC 19527]MCV7190082.1 S9 family peptidase [Mycolicibacterium thermoresistibile]GAT13861.1 peptidase S9 prolyl oligopeptidase [Mycolicibacterium thermoresistibile]SNW19034.1 peptidase S9 prolyl oligopeptidase [Mycolicibacterium thermoresistibile]
MTSPTPFYDLDDYLAVPRVSGLAVAPDGSRLVTTIAELDADRTAFVTALWELDPAGQRPARRLTRGAKGESSPAFTGEGDLLFLAARPLPAAPGGENRAGADAAGSEGDPPVTLWRLPAVGGEAVSELALPGAISAVRTARNAPATVVAAPMLPSAADIDDDRRLRGLRRDNKITAILHSGYPVRHWDHDLGPDQPHLLDADGPRDLSPRPGDGLREVAFDVSADGRFVITTWAVPEAGAARRVTLVRIDRATGERSTLLSEPEANLGSPAISPDGTAVAYLRETLPTPDTAPRVTLCRLRFGSEPQVLTEDWDRWPETVSWTVDGTALLVTADDHGRRPIFRVDPDTGAVTRLTHDDHAYTDVCPAPGGVIFALRSSYAAPPHPVRIDPDGTVTEIPCVDRPRLPGTVTELVASAGDGTPIRAWLVLPERDDPAPLLLWIHGGPLGSWNSWHWRWNPWLLAAQGYAVLLPDPGLSTGYGQEFIQRGWGAWGAEPYTDLLAAVDAATADPRIDGTRTAAMGGSFGGYMANWIAGHTDRFDAIVTHAGLWALDQFGGTTDSAYWWGREMTPQMAERNSPHRHVANIATPMLVIHGDKDYRVPIGEALRLWYDLLHRSKPAADADGVSPHRFLYFPSENHWVLKPQHAKLWYQVVIAFLARHVLGRDVEPPETLG